MPGQGRVAQWYGLGCADRFFHPRRIHFWRTIACPFSQCVAAGTKRFHRCWVRKAPADFRKYPVWPSQVGVRDNRWDTGSFFGWERVAGLPGSCFCTGSFLHWLCIRFLVGRDAARSVVFEAWPVRQTGADPLGARRCRWSCCSLRLFPRGWRRQMKPVLARRWGMVDGR